MKTTISLTFFLIINIFAFPLKSDPFPSLSSEFVELDPITAFLKHPQADQKIKDTIEIKLDLKTSQQTFDDLAKAWDAFNSQSQSEYISQLGFPTNNK